MKTISEDNLVLVVENLCIHKLKSKNTKLILPITNLTSISNTHRMVSVTSLLQQLFAVDIYYFQIKSLWLSQ